MNTPHQELLRKIKDQTGWSEPRIASEIKTSQATVNRLLNGQPSCQVQTYLAIEELAQRLRIVPKHRARTTKPVTTPP
jgi:DNA-binding LacI/PurR family transcriptional regulator